jgi:hypothetical protein
VRRAFLFLACLCVCPASAQTKAVPLGTPAQADTFPQADKPYWLGPRATVRLCPKPMPDIIDRVQCPVMKQGKFTVTEVLLFNQQPAYYRIEGAEQSGYVLARERVNFLDEDPQATTARSLCARYGEPKLGMTPAEVAATCWGKPLAVKAVGEGSERVQHVYSNGRFLYYENGVLVAIDNRR